MTQNKIAVIFSSDYKKGVELRSMLECMPDVTITTKCKSELTMDILRFAESKGTNLLRYPDTTITDISTQCYMIKDCAVIYDFSEIFSVFSC